MFLLQYIGSPMFYFTRLPTTFSDAFQSQLVIKYCNLICCYYQFNDISLDRLTWGGGFGWNTSVGELTEKIHFLTEILM